MAKGDAFWRREERRNALNEAEKRGEVADSIEVRKALIARMQSGEMTLDEVQAELARIKRTAKKHGKKTRAGVYSGRT